ncbi:hypothetical protein WA026_003622 [Henosepilachna vigintioctopunctata]|uniref:EF-hand domain-containing family member C2 n=1 Tax=Henosepilachna vigintioctopunctata TaxID=420089 RepID=A0AAW1TNJ4_9CUCU
MNLRCPDLPFLPGWSFNPNIGRTRFNVDRKFDFIGAPKDGNRALIEKVKPNMFGPLTDRYPSIYARGEVLDIPPWLVFDKQVLRFDAFFKETLQEVRGSPYQIRKVIIYFYLEDGTIQVCEPKVENSGVFQGCFLSRQRIRFPAPMDENFYDIIDLNIGKEVEFYGRCFKIIDCDKFTRTFLNRCGICVPDPITLPTDPYLDLRQKEREAIMSKKPKRSKDTRGQFLEYDKKVLRFFGYWDDQETEYGYLHKLEIHYFLSDDTIEIKETVPENSGRDSGFMFLKREKLPKTYKSLPGPGDTAPHTLLNVLGAGVHGGRYILDPLDRDLKQQYYKENDLAISSIINCYGRKIVLTDWDPFTRSYYSLKYGLDHLPPGEMPRDKSEQVKTTGVRERQLPPWNGFGSFEDSAQNCITVEPKAPVRDFKKFLKYDRIGLDSHVLRFSAKLLSKIPDNCRRKFIISYFLSDDTIGVYEVCDGGRTNFFSRAPIVIPGQPIFTSNPPLKYTPQHMFVGATIVINSYVFVLTDADDYCLRYMEINSQEYPKANLKLIMDKVRDKLRPFYKDFVAEMMPNESSVLSYEVLRNKLCAVMGEDFTEHEMITISRAFSADCTKVRFDRERIRAITLTELKRFLWDDLERLREYFLARDPERKGKLSRQECYTVLRACRLPLDKSHVEKILDVIKKDENCLYDYEDILKFMNRKVCPMADTVPINLKYNFWWASEREPEAGRLIDWCAFNKYLDLEHTFKEMPSHEETLDTLKKIEENEAKLKQNNKGEHNHAGPVETSQVLAK